MDNIAQRLKAYIESHPFDPGDSNCDTVLDQLYQVYAESHEFDPLDIRDGFKELDDLLGNLMVQVLPHDGGHGFLFPVGNA